MNTIETGSSSSNIIIYVMTVIGTTLTDHWYLIGMFAFGAIHAFVAYQKNQREEEIHALNVAKLKSYNE